MRIRKAQEGDLVRVDPVLRVAFGRSGSFRPLLRRCYRLQPDGWWIAETDLGIWGYGGAVDYGDLAYIGLISVHPQVQRRGIGGQILGTILGWLEGRGCPVAVLDASPAGLSLYRSQGFVEIERSFTYVASGSPMALDPPALDIKIQFITVSDFEEVIAFDSQILGADRSRLLRPLLWEYLERGLIARDSWGQIVGFILAQMDTLGPWLAKDVQIAEALLSRALRLPFGPQLRVYLSGSCPVNPADLARWGFDLKQTLAHMQRGSDHPIGQRQRLYGLINYALG